MKVFKFGGASVKNADAVKNVATVLELFRGEQLVVVVSAMGKTTNALEMLTDAYYRGDDARKHQLSREIKSFHEEVIGGLLKNSSSHTYDDIENLFIELECLLETPAENTLEYNYDQIVCYGELFSTRIVSAYLNEAGIRNRWMDARNFISTDNTYKEGKVDWDLTSNMISRKLRPIVQKQMVVTQGFIGQNKEHLSTTLGREGSDYTAAIFGYGLEADSVTIWKDVDGVMNGDPKKISNAVKLDELSYSQAIEMAYFGATVIHPKTIQPLQSKNIPLFVKSFLKPEGAGTVVSNSMQEGRIPTFISKQDQLLLSISSKDFSFIVEDNLSKIFSVFAHHGVKINMMQNSAISFTVCVDDRGESVDRLRNELSINYVIRTNENAELLTVMHYDDAAIEQAINGREVLMEQRTRSTMQFVIR